MSRSRTLLEKDAAALARAAATLDPGRVDEIAARCSRAKRLLVSGVGKSYLLSRLVGATLAALRTPTLALHPTDALHGDLGQVQLGDVALLFSTSGESDEIVRLADQLAKRRAWVIAITSNPTSRLACHANEILTVPRVEDDGPAGLVPTTSSLVMLAFGHALCLAIAEARGVSIADLAQSHPGGSIGAAAAAAAGVSGLRIEDFVDRHAGEDILVCGTGPSARAQSASLGAYRIIAVNDFEAVVGVRPDYLVILNPEGSFGPRWESIARHTAPWTFSHLKLPPFAHSQLVPFELGTRYAQEFAHRGVLNYSLDSTFVGATLALHMGARRIGLLGADFVGHPDLEPQMVDINRAYLRLATWCRASGCEVVTLGSRSALTTLPAGVLSDFRPVLPAAAAGEDPRRHDWPIC